MADNLADLSQGIMLTAFRSETERAIEKILLVDLIEQHYGRLLHDLVFQGRDGDRPFLPVFLGDIDPAQRACPLPLALNPIMEI